LRYLPFPGVDADQCFDPEFRNEYVVHEILRRLRRRRGLNGLLQLRLILSEFM
jgi:hypothetical protein